MRITFILPYAGLGGGTRVIAEYAKRLSWRGHRITVVSTPRAQLSLRQKVRSLRSGNGWPGKSQPGPSHIDGLEIEHRVIDRSRPIIDADVPDADVVIATWWETAEWVARLSANKGAKTYFVQHDERVMAINPKMIQRVEATWRLPLRKITIAQWIADLLAKEAGEQIAVVPNSVDQNLFHAMLRDKQAVPTVGFMYATSRFKGADITMEAISKARAEIPNLQVIAFGESPLKAVLPLPSGTEYHEQPPQKQIREIYAKCDAWLFGSRCEGFGLPILEAMACRTPVIGTPAGAALQLLGQGGGILIKPESSVDMAAAIERISRMGNDEWKRFSDAAYATAIQYTWDDATDLFETALKGAVSRQMSRRASDVKSEIKINQ